MRKQTVKLFWHIQWQKTKKRQKMNQDIITMMIDPVTAIYLIPFIVIGGLVMRDALIENQHIIQTISDQIFTRDIILFGFIGGQLGLFKKAPILLYSSSERLMEYLTHRRRDLFSLLWLKKSTVYLLMNACVFLLLILIFPDYTQQVGQFIFMLTLTQVSLIVLKFYLFTLNGWRGYIHRGVIQLINVSLIVYLAVLTTDKRFMVLTFLLVMALIGLILSFFYIEDVKDLDYIISVSDSISYQTVLSKLFFSKTIAKDTPIKRHAWYDKKRYRQRLKTKTMWKLYHRLIWQHLSEQSMNVFQMFMLLMAMIILLSLQGVMFLRIGLVLAVLLFLRMQSVIFQSIFDRELLKSLPLRQGPWSQHYGFYSIFSHTVFVLLLIGYSHLFYPKQFTVVESFTFLLITVILNREWLKRIAQKLILLRPKETSLFTLSMLYLVGYAGLFSKYPSPVYVLASIIAGLAVMQLISSRFRSEKHDRR